MFHARENIVGYFKKGIFPFKGNLFKTKEEKSEKKSGEKTEKSINDGIVFIKEKSKYINNDLFNKYFKFSAPIDLAKKLFETKDTSKNIKLVEEIKNRWSNLKDETKKLSKEEVKYEKPNDILGIINNMLDFNKAIQKPHGLRFRNIYQLH